MDAALTEQIRAAHAASRGTYGAPRLQLDHEIAAITGHASLKEVVRYTNTVDRKRLARAAMDKMKT
jgi:hypothetical protein